MMEYLGLILCVGSVWFHTGLLVISKIFLKRKFSSVPNNQVSSCISFFFSIRNRSTSSGLELVFSHTENSSVLTLLELILLILCQLEKKVSALLGTS